MTEKYVKLQTVHKTTGIGRKILEAWVDAGKLRAIKQESGARTYTLLLMSEVEADLLKLRTERVA